MSTRKVNIAPRKATPKSNIKTSTPRLNSTSKSYLSSKTEPKLHSKVVKNLNAPACSGILNSTTIVDPTHSQKYMQHKLDMAYNKYLQTLALNSWLTKMHKDSEISIDEQLTHFEEMHESALEEEQTQKDLLNEMQTLYATENKLKCLEISLHKITKFMEEKDLINKIKKLNSNLHYFCDKLMFENIKFVSSEENYTHLQEILEAISTTLNEIKDENNEDFVLFAGYIFKIIELLKIIRKNQAVVKNYQNDINNLTLRAASIQLTKSHNNASTLKK